MILGISGYINSGKDTVGKMIQYLEYCKDFPHNTRSFEDWEQNVRTHSKWKIKKFAGKLKQIATLLTGIPVEKFESQEFKSSLLGKEWEQWRVKWTHGDDGPGSATFQTEAEAEKFIEDGFEDALEEIKDAGLLSFERMTVREFLQKLGTEGLRNGLHNQVWVNALFADYKRGSQEAFEPKDRDFPNWIITDVRFPNEAQAIKDLGGVVVRIERFDERFQKLELGGDIGTKYAIDKTKLHPSETSLDRWDFDYVINNNETLEQLLEATKTLLNNIKD